jgi:GTPase Era involved in 16S rRNA processing
MAEPIGIAVVGHTNAGKTSLLRTLTRRRDFGEVSPRPGTTRHVESVDLIVDGEPALRFFDTPGLEDPIGLRDALGPLHADMTPPQRIRAFLATRAAQESFEQEAKVLRSLLDIDAALFVIDCREPVLAKFRCEVEILASCGKPVLPVLNFVRDPASREAQWSALLADFALHAQARFDAVAPFDGAQAQLYASLQVLLPQRRVALEQVAAFLESERADRHEAGLRLIADTLLSLAAMRITLSRDEVEAAARKAAIVERFRAEVLQRARRAVQDLLDVHAFARDDAELAMLPWLDGRWAADLFHSETLRDAGARLGKGAAIGAGIGLAADVALAGLSLGSAAVLGAAIGGAASQGFGPLGRRLANTLQGRQELSLEDAVLTVVAQRLLRLHAALGARGHAANERIDLAHAALPAAQLQAVLRALQPARAHAAWADGDSPRREATLRAVLATLRASG